MNLSIPPRVTPSRARARACQGVSFRARRLPCNSGRISRQIK
ncbi:MAG: hypothetical protein Q6373_017260 [Candidatus Sigynarchaeota archaeon]